MTVLQANNITKQFEEAGHWMTVLKDVSLALDEGEIVLLEGPSGSGKTTLLSIIGCILSASSGRVSIEGQEIDPDSPRQLAEVRKRSIGFVFQQYNLIPALTASENVEYAMNIKGVRGAEAAGLATKALAQVGMSDRADALPKNLSGGQKQRVAIARAIAGRSPILLVDEPTANLDSQSGDQILELFRRIAKQDNRAMLIVTHDSKLRFIADRVLTIRDGCVLN